MKPEKQILHHCHLKAKEHLKAGELDKSRDYCDMGIAYTASRRNNGMTDKDEVEGVRIELWLERFWMFLENNNLMLG